MEPSFLNYCDKLGQAVILLFEVNPSHMPLNAVTTIFPSPWASNHFWPFFLREWMEARCWVADSENRKLFVLANRLYNIHTFS